MSRALARAIALAIGIAWLCSFSAAAQTAADKPYPWAAEKMGAIPQKYWTLPPAELAQRGYVVAADWPDLPTTSERLTRLLRARDFALLDRAFGELDAARRYADGTPIRPRQFAVFTWIKEPNEDDLALLHAWRAGRPESVLARLIEVHYWQERAWEARGGGYADTVSPGQWRLFGERLARARALLVEYQPQVRASALFSLLELQVLAPVDSSERGAFDAAFLRSSRQWPGYAPLYVVYGTMYLPQWAGRAVDAGKPQQRESWDVRFHEFVVRSASVAFAESKPSAVARLYAQFDDEQAKESAAAHWPAVKPSFERWVADEKTARQSAVWAYRSFACRARDRDAAASAYATIQREKLFPVGYRAEDDGCLLELSIQL